MIKKTIKKVTPTAKRVAKTARSTDLRSFKKK